MKINKSGLKINLLCHLLALVSGSVMAQTVIPLINPSFETNTDGVVFTAKVSSGFDVPGADVAGWTDVGAGNNACGVDYQGDNGITVHSGTVCAWTQGGKPGAFQVTGYQIQAGDQLTLTWWAKSTYSPSGNTDQSVQLLSATNTTDVYTNLSSLAVTTAALNNTGNGGAYSQYTLNYLATGADVGKYVAVSFSSPTGGNHYAAFDDFNLTVQPNQNLPILATCVAGPNPCYALSAVSITNDDTGTGTGTVYQWQTNSDLSGGFGGEWGNVSGATTLAISVNPPDINPGGANYTLDYRLIASNTGGSVTSAPVALIVMPAALPVLSVDTTPSSVNINAGDTVSFTAAFVGTTPIAYQWQTDADQPGVFSNVPYATNSTLTLVNPHIGNYQLTASNILGGASSTAASLTVNPVFFSNLILNPGFETNTAGMVFNTKVYNGFDVPGNEVAAWNNTGTNYGDSGVDYAGDNGLTVASGHVAAYLHAGDDGAYQVTGYKLQAGDQLTLTWWAKSLYLVGAQQVQLMVATNVADAYSNLTVLATSTDPLYYSGNGADYFQYTLNYTVLPEDVGKYLAVSFINNATGNSYAAFDDFNLNVLQASPTISARLSGSQLKLNWLDGVLLEATNVAGPWTTNIYAVSPFTVTPVGPGKFYRTQLQ